MRIGRQCRQAGGRLQPARLWFLGAVALDDRPGEGGGRAAPLRTVAAMPAPRDLRMDSPAAHAPPEICLRQSILQQGASLPGGDPLPLRIPSAGSAYTLSGWIRRPPSLTCWRQIAFLVPSGEGGAPFSGRSTRQWSTRFIAEVVVESQRPIGMHFTGSRGLGFSSMHIELLCQWASSG